MDQIGWMGLDDALAALREELQSAWKKAAGQDLQFPVETLTVELKVDVLKRADSRAGFSAPRGGRGLATWLREHAGTGGSVTGTIPLVLGGC